MELKRWPLHCLVSTYSLTFSYTKLPTSWSLWLSPLSFTHSFCFQLTQENFANIMPLLGEFFPFFFFFLVKTYSSFRGLPRWLNGKESTFQCRKCRGCSFDPWERKWQPTPVSLPGKSHGQRSPVDYSPWGRRVRQNLVIKQQHLSEDSRMKIVSLGKPSQHMRKPISNVLNSSSLSLQLF